MIDLNPLEKALEAYRQGTSSKSTIIVLMNQAINWAFEEGRKYERESETTNQEGDK